MPEYPRVAAVVAIGEGWLLDDDALPDTGFSGGVVVPHRAVDDIPVAPDRGRLRLGDGQRVEAFWWSGELSIQSAVLTVTIWALGDDFLIGREVLDQLEICFEFGRRVRLRFEE